MRILIIGGGIAGLSTAYWLVQRGYHPTVLAGDPGVPSATWAAGGMLCPAQELDFSEVPLLHAGRESLGLYPQWEAELGEIGLRREGTLEVALHAEDVPLLERQFNFQKENGQRVEWHTGAALHRLEPGLSQAVPAGIFAPADWQVDNRLLLKQLRAWLVANGCPFWALPAESATATAGGWTVRAGGRPFTAEALVVATGTASLPGLSLPEPIYPIHGQMLSLDPGQPPALRKTVRIRSHNWGAGYLIPKAGRLVIGATSEERGHGRAQYAGAVLDLLRKAYAAVPAVYDLPLQTSWAGLRPATLDRQPLLAQPQSGLFVLNGLYRHGILLGPLAGREMATWVVEDRPPRWLAAAAR